MLIAFFIIIIIIIKTALLSKLSRRFLSFDLDDAALKSDFSVDLHRLNTLMSPDKERFEYWTSWIKEITGVMYFVMMKRSRGRVLEPPVIDKG